MDHREAEKRLLAYADGELDRNRREALMLHIEGCVECRSWLETHDLLGRASEPCPGEQHLASETLALWAVFPEEEDDLGERAEHEHLDDCAVCRQELKQMRNAVVEARSEIEHPVPPASRDFRFSWWQLAAAACVLAVAGKVIVPFTSMYFDSDVSRPSDLSVKVEEKEQLQAGVSGTAIKEEEFGGTRVIRAEGSLTMCDVKIMDGARVTIRADEVVAFDNGFQVGRETELTVGATGGGPTRVQ